jgi:hypothetical protein
MTRPYDLQYPIETLFTQIDDVVRYAFAGGHPHGEAQYVKISFLLIIATQRLPLVCAEWQRRVPNIQTCILFKAFFTEAHRENSMIIQTALRLGCHTVNMGTQVPAGQLQTCDVENLEIAAGYDRETVAALIKSLDDPTALTKDQAKELRRLVISGHINPVLAPTPDASATGVRGNGRQRRTRNNEKGNVGRPSTKPRMISIIGPTATRWSCITLALPALSARRCTTQQPLIPT